MKNAILLYNLIVILICLIFNTIAIFEEGAELEFLLLSEFLLIIGLYYGIKTALEPKLHIGNFFFFIFNLLQVLTIGVFGFVYKLSYGPQIFINLFNQNDWFLDVDLNFYTRILYIFQTPPDGLFFIGINIIQLLLTIYFFKEMRKISGYILPKQVLDKSEIKIHNKTSR
ncbi:hypothetical protein [Christiangramia aquimixticola]|uniref:hypothetical protein n=1 Tax=Christiangramia aquimixticola TaxID=1697558 RepID=UPI003AA929A4